MRKLIVSFVIAFLAAMTVNAQNKLTIESITKGEFSLRYPASVTPLAGGDSYARLNPDRNRIEEYSYKNGQLIRCLFDAGEVAGAEIEEIDGFQLSPDGTKILLYTNSNYIYRRSFTADYYVYDIKTKNLNEIDNTGAQQSCIWAKDSRHVAFVRDNNVFVADVVDRKLTQVSTDGKRNEIINGIPDWVNEEEFGFNTAMAFNDKANCICWIRYDESRVKTYELELFKGLKPEIQAFADYPGKYSYKYPKAGQDNAMVSAWCYDLNKGTTLKINLPLPREGYIPRVVTLPGSNDVVFYTMNRHQDSLMIYRANTVTGECRLMLNETVKSYVKEEAMEEVAFTEKYMMLPSDRDGFMQVYLYNLDGKLLKKITSAQYGISHIYGYDAKAEKLYYQAAGRSPMEREVYVSDLKGHTRCLTPEVGWNSAVFSDGFKFFVHSWSDRNHPTVYTLKNQKGKVINVMEDNKEVAEKIKEYGLPEKELFSFTTSEGVQLNGWMVKPADFDENRKYPVILHQYSGPGSQQVVNAWHIGSMGQGALYDQYLTQQGFIVACVDGRGTGGRGADFEKCTYLMLGKLEAKDQVETALYLASLPYVDKNNIGIWGWSYGGFCTLMSLSEGRPAFKAGVAVAPPTNWKFYDSVYTERFMRTPQENPDGYGDNPIVRADKLHGALLLCHGVADDNVHPQNTYEYAEALVQADKDFHEVLYTNRNHGIRGGNSRNHLLRQITQFFSDKLK